MLGKFANVLRSVIVAVVALFLSMTVKAQEFIESAQSIRQLGMGGVYVFHENDAGSFLQNPAYTCFTNGLNWTVFDLATGINGLELARELSDIGEFEGLESLTPLYGKHIWVGLGGHSTFTLPCFGVSGWNYGSLGMVLHNPSFPNLHASLINDYAMQIGGALPLSKNISFGLSAKRVVRRGGDVVIGVSSLRDITTGAILDSFHDQGVGFGLDAGITMRMVDNPMKPTLSVAWKDVGTTNFILSHGTTAPKRQEDNLVMALTLGNSLYGFGFSGGLEYRHINQDDVQLGQKLHLGAELNLALVDLRAGLHQGYTSYGMGVNLWFLDLDMAMYSVEKGYYPGQSEEQRIQVGLKIDVGFDANFNFMKTDSKSRRARSNLKLRR